MATETRLCHTTSSTASRPSWLRSAVSDLERRFQSLALPVGDGSAEFDSFADRAENYYQKRPQLLSLIHDLYHGYLSLADRYAQAILKPHQHRRWSSDGDDSATDLSSDAESSLSFQPPRRPLVPPDAVVTELVTRAVENELLRHEVHVLGRESGEWARKVGLQRSLLEVLESERAVLLAENARLSGRAEAAEAEAGAARVAAEEMRRRAEELARLVVRVREEHRACALGRRIEALQAQVYGLERRNREGREAVARREGEKAELFRGLCVEVEMVKAENRRLQEALAEAGRRRRRAGMWRRAVRAVAAWVVCGRAAPPVRRKRPKDDDEIVGCGHVAL